ncbi:hypothetical protein CsSME_00046094 [Camellia sinensis var. sinensis]
MTIKVRHPHGSKVCFYALFRDQYAKRAVKTMLEKVIDVDPLDALEMIDDSQRLGVFYHFKDEIEKALEKIYNMNDKCNNEDLHATALKFRVLRQHWYNVPQGTSMIYSLCQFQKF